MVTHIPLMYSILLWSERFHIPKKTLESLPFESLTEFMAKKISIESRYVFITYIIDTLLYIFIPIKVLCICIMSFITRLMTLIRFQIRNETKRQNNKKIIKS